MGYLTVSEKGLILEANLTAANLLGRARGVLVKQLLSQFILPEDQDIYYELRKQLFETGNLQACDLRIGKPDGTAFWAQLIATNAQDADSSLVCRVVISDITEQKQMESQFLRAQRMQCIGTLAGGIAHDLNNIFSPILMSLPLLRSPLDTVDLNETLNLVESSTKRGALIVNLPNLDGLQLARALHLMNPEVKIILSSGVTEALTDGIIAEFKTYGVVGQIAKPYTADILLNMLYDILHPYLKLSIAG